MFVEYFNSLKRSSQTELNLYLLKQTVNTNMNKVGLNLRYDNFVLNLIAVPLKTHGPMLSHLWFGSSAINVPNYLRYWEKERRLQISRQIGLFSLGRINGPSNTPD